MYRISNAKEEYDLLNFKKIHMKCVDRVAQSV
jgi:hypothetical protein